MNNESICPICRESGYREHHINGKDVDLVDCNHCGRFYISDPACYELEDNPLTQDKIQIFRDRINEGSYKDLWKCIVVDDIVGN